MTVFYGIIYFLIIVLVFWSPKDRRLNVILLMFLALALSFPAYRTFGRDRDMYIEALVNNSLISERSFSFIGEFVEHTGMPIECVFLIYAVVAISIVLMAIYLFNRRIWWCVLVYYANWYVVHPMIQIRAACAVAFFLLAVVCTRTLWRIVPLSFSVFWHHSAFIGILAFYLSKFKVSTMGALSIVCVALLVYFSGIGFGSVFSLVPIGLIRDGFAKYNTSMDVGQNIDYHALGIWRMIQIFILFVCVMRNKSIGRHLGSNMIINLWGIGLCWCLVFTDFPALSARGMEFLCSVEIFLVPVFLYNLLGANFGKVAVVLYAGASTVCCVIRTQLFDGMELLCF